MGHVERLSIRSFRSIQRLDCELDAFSVLVGPNGAGKTNVVEALRLLGQIVDQGSVDVARKLGWARLVRRAPLPAPSVTLGATVYSALRVYRPPSHQVVRTLEPLRFALAVTLGDRDGAVRVYEESLEVRAIADDAVLYRGSAASSDPARIEVFDEARLRAACNLRAHEPLSVVPDPPRAEDDEHDEDDGRFLRLLGRFSPWRFMIRGSLLAWRFRFEAASLRSEGQDQQSLDEFGHNLPTEVARLSEAKRDRVLALLQEVYGGIERLEAVDVGAGRRALRFHERGIGAPLAAEEISDGVLHALALILVLTTRGGQGVVVLEEPENALHPWSVQRIVELAQEEVQQTLLTTHSEAVVDAVRDPRCLMLVERGDEGTTVVRATDREAALAPILARTGQRLGDVWLDGSLGGVPRSPG